MNPMPGTFIALEGGEGAGKSTQARMLADAVRGYGVEVVLTREPGGTAGAEAIRGLLLGPEHVANKREPLIGNETCENSDSGDGWPMRAEALLFAAARADHVARLIRPALAMNKWVICDRFLDSSRAYQGAGGGLTDRDILRLHTIGSEGLLPDLTLLIEVAPDEAAARLARRDGDFVDRIGGRDAAYHARVAAAFAGFAEAEPVRFARIDSNGSREATHRQIMAAVAPLLARAV